MKKAYRTSVVALAASMALVAVGATPALAGTATVAQYLANDNVKNVPSSAVAMGGSSFDKNLVLAAYSAWTNGQSNNSSSLSAYQSSSSGTGRANLLSGTFGIGFSDVPLNAAGQDTSNTSVYAQVPVALGGVALVYNINMQSSASISAVAPHTGAPVTVSLAGCTTLINNNTLILSPAEIAGIFAGSITSWNNSAIVASNPELLLSVMAPDKAASGSKSETFTYTKINCLNYLTAENIKLYSRAAGSGTTFILRDYLNQIDPTDFPYPSSAAFTAAISSSNSNSQAVASAVTSNDGGFGYVEQSYAIQNPALQVARLVNRSHNIVALNATSVAVAATLALKAINTSSCGGFSTDQADTYVAANVNTACFSLDNQGGAAYPIAGVSYAIVKKDQSNQAAGETAVKFLEYLSQTGQSLATANYYVPLPATIQALAFSILKTVKVPNGAAQVQAVSTTL
jgi:phosphate transport system substrate-binding protein